MEYVIILVAILALALILSSFLANDGQSMIKDKIIAIINGNNTGEKAKQSDSSSGVQQETVAKEKKQAKTSKKVEISDEQLMQMSDLAYEDIFGLSK